MISPEILRRYPYFAGVSEHSLKALAAISEERSAKAGDVLFRENQPATHLYVISEGEVDIRYVLASGQHKTVDTLVGGDLMVWSAVVEPHTTHSVGVVRKDTRLVVIEGARLRELMDKDPVLGHRVAIEIATAVASRLKGARVQLATLS